MKIHQYGKWVKRFWIQWPADDDVLRRCTSHETWHKTVPTYPFPRKTSVGVHFYYIDGQEVEKEQWDAFKG